MMPSILSVDVDGINSEMRKLLAENFCPQCSKHNKLHDDEACNMRWEKEEEEIYG
jgi:hypothetical protein